jgi:hypothetical protein
MPWASYLMGEFPPCHSPHAPVTNVNQGVVEAADVVTVGVAPA